MASTHLFIAISVLACAACGGVAEREERQPWTVDGEDSNADAATPAARDRTGSAGVNTGVLRTSFSQSARETVCVTTEADGRIAAMDEFFCEALPDDEQGGERARCGGCTMGLKPARDGHWLLAAQEDAEACAVFAGSYLLVPPSRASQCTAPSLTPCGDTYCVGECEFGPHGTPVCVERAEH